MSQNLQSSSNPRPASGKTGRGKPRWRVAIITNIQEETELPLDVPEDALAEYSRSETIQAIRHSLESAGHSVVVLNASPGLPARLLEFAPQICFNDAEGISGDAREAQVPALLELMGIPYTGSRVLANALSLNKGMTKYVWRGDGLPTANFQEFVTGREDLDPGLCFPLFVKPQHEGTSIGIDENALVSSEPELRERLQWIIQRYRQPALVEEFLSGREFSVGILGRKGLVPCTPRADLYGPDGYHAFPILEVDTARSVTPGIYGYTAKALLQGESGVPRFICPADVPPALAQRLQSLAQRAHESIGALDISRVDLRLDATGQPRLLEINTLPGLYPGFSDLCLIAAAGGLRYEELILEILYLGASRFPLTSKPNRAPLNRAG